MIQPEDNDVPAPFIPLDNQEQPIPGEGHAPVPRWLLVLYAVTLSWGLLWLILFWNGSAVPWFDRGAWWALQHAANTTYPWTAPGEGTTETSATTGTNP